jgi:4-amino-4-deoxy-L-arabinose transferase-like glycosyltransferase
VVSCYLVGCAVFPHSRLLSIAVPAFALLLPGHIVNLACVTNDGLAELFSCLTIWAGVRIVRTQACGLARCAVMGALVGAGLLTKTSCVFLVPVALLAVGLARSPHARQPHSWAQFLAGAGVMLGVAAGLWGGWIIHNLRYYPGDPLVTRTFVEIFGKDRARPETFLAGGLSFASYLRLVATWTYLSFWGVFGQARVFMPNWYYAFGTVILAVAGVGAIAGLSRWRSAERVTKEVWSSLGLACILVVLQFLQFNMTFFQAQARYLFPAIAPVACLFVAGGHRSWRLTGFATPGAPVWSGWAWVGLACALAIMLAAALAEVASRGAPASPPPWIGLPSLGP